jgi:AraC-like DNA-binding protein
MIKNFYFLLLLIVAISCSSPAEKQKKAETDFQKKEIVMLDHLEFSGNSQLIIKTAKEYKQYAKKINYDYGVFKCNMSLIFAYNASGKYKEAVIIGEENDALIDKIKANYIVCLNYTNVSSAYSYLGLFDEAKNYLNKALAYNEKLKNDNDKYYSLGVIYSGFAFLEGMKGESSPNLEEVQKSYLKELWALQQVDSSKKMAQKKNMQLSLVYLNLGCGNDQMKNPKEAEQYFYKALNICKKYKFTNNMPLFLHLTMAQFFLDQKKFDSSIVYAQKGIVLEKKNHSPDTRRDLFEVLYRTSQAKGDKQNAEKYTNLYMKLNDSLTNAEKRGINTPVRNIIKDKEEDHKSNLTTILSIIGAAILTLSFIVFFLWRRNQKIQYAKYEKVINQLKNKENFIASQENNNKLNSSNEKNLNIHDDTVNSILRKLDKFEKSEKFLKKDLTIGSLAAQLNTNTKYLSEIIKNNRSQNFSNYINSLRISYIVHKLYNEPKYREYKISYLAEECGYASSQVFVIAFKKINGLTPSFFIQNLKEDRVNTAQTEDMVS